MHTRVLLNACSGVFPRLYSVGKFLSFSLSLSYFLFLSLSHSALCSSHIVRFTPFYSGTVQTWYRRRFSVSVSLSLFVAAATGGLLTNVHCTKLSALSTTLRAVPPHHLPSILLAFFFFFFSSAFPSSSVRRRARRRRRRRQRRLQKRAGSRTVTATIMTQRRRCGGLPRRRLRRRRKNVGGDNAGATPGGDSARTGRERVR